MMFHDDDVVPDIDSKSPNIQIRKEAKELKKRLEDSASSPKWSRPACGSARNTIDGAYTSNDKKCRQYAIDRSLRCIDIANILDTDLIVLWLAREGSYLRESKDARRASIISSKRSTRCSRTTKSARLCHRAQAERADGPRLRARPSATPSPSPRSRAIRSASVCLIESAHAILAGLDPADEIDFAMKFGKLWSLHLNDQNGLKFDQDRPFGNVSLRSRVQPDSRARTQRLRSRKASMSASTCIPSAPPRSNTGWIT
jgi:xylose isomerase